ncbi:MAG: hypothetical protein HN390_05400 [Anaerolineae bacterium]|jgi:hypothetical protein|nr:hypothetical protein [Anaerolineae bacterium]MBT7191089.1 hypothetical protein [Anaerolineae bacterium]MBT7988476.1 hypothetical protein [Anaerolineae bacterium]
MKAILKKYPWIAFILINLGILILAFPLQSVVKKMIIAPVMYFFWILGILYHAIPQVLLWSGLLVIIFIIGLFNFINIPRPRWHSRQRQKDEPGPIEALAANIKKSDEGVYFKWHLANRIGFVARDWLAYREGQEKKWKANTLEGRNWHPEEDVQTYLSVGLKGSFADYPRPRNPFKKRPKTPLDIDPNKALDYLESHMETGHGHNTD